MNCPRCNRHLHDEAVVESVHDTRHGLVVALSYPPDVTRCLCVCGWTYTLTSAVDGAA